MKSNLLIPCGFEIRYIQIYRTQFILILGFLLSSSIFAQTSFTCTDLKEYLSDPPDEALSEIEKSEPWLKDIYLEQMQSTIHRPWALYHKAISSDSSYEKRRLILEAQAAHLEQSGNKIKSIEAPNEEALLKISPSLIQKPSSDLLLDVAKDHLFLGQLTQANRILQKLKKKAKSYDQKTTVLELLRRTKKQQKKFTESIKIGQELYLLARKAGKKNDIYDYGVEYARSLWTNSKAIHALAVLQALLSENKESAKRAEVNWLIGRIFYERKNYDEAELKMRDALSLVPKEEYYWSLYWALYRQKKWTKAFKLGEEAVQSLKPNDSVRFRFWNGKINKAMGKPYVEIFEKLMNEDVYTYYALLSAMELNKKLPEAPSEIDITKEIKSLDSKAIELLNECGEKTYRSYLTRSKKIDSNLRPYFMAHGGYYLPLFSLDQNRGDIWSRHAQRLFPIRFESEISSALQKTPHIPESLVFALIRQESAFDPLARSPADARGLMQVLPLHTKENLFEPSTNIREGLKVLGRYLKANKGKIIFVAAQYNAGQKPLSNWKKNIIKKKKIKDPLEFIEEIPYDETRNYVKIILRNYLIYDILLGKNPTREFPKDLLKI